MKMVVSFGRTISLRKFNTVRLEWTRELEVGEMTFEQATEDLKNRMDAFLTKLGVTIVE